MQRAKIAVSDSPGLGLKTFIVFQLITLTPTLNLTSSLGYFFDSGPLRVPKVVTEEVFGHTGSLGNFSINICREVKTRIFSNREKDGGGISHSAKNNQILKSSFFTRFCPKGIRRVENFPWD